MKICQVLAGAEDGGLEKHTIELTHELVKQGVDVTVIAHEKYIDDFRGIPFIALDLTKGRNNLLILWKLYRILKKEQFDIVHTQANKATAMIIRLQLFLTSKIVATLHNYKKNLKPFLKADAVITVSDRIGEKINSPHKFTVYNGIKIKNESAIDVYETFHVPRDKFIICSVGRLVEAKGFDLLIESIPYMEEDIEVLLIGDGPLRKELEKLVKKLKVVDRIKFVGNIENVLTKSIIKSSDLLVVSSRREGFSYVFAESLLLDTPIVSTDVADIKKFITEEYIVPFDAKILAESINKFKRKYPQNISEYQTIFEKAKKTFTVENMAAQTRTVYEKVLG